MSFIRVLYQMVRADFLERTRRYSFLLTLGFAIFLGYAAYSGKIVMKLEDYRGVLNSAWVGAMMSAVTTSFLSLVGFYIVRDSVARDTKTRVGRILAATPISKTFYVLAKTLSNFVVLLAMVAILALCAAAMQLLKGEAQIQPWPLLAPFLIFVVPVMLVVAALAIFFETAPLLRSGLGNVLYFFLWSALLTSDIERKIPTFLGFTSYMSSMGDVLRKIEPAYKGGMTLNVGGNSATKTFVWQGLHWNGEILLGRLFWLGVALALCYAAAFFFDRFDPARRRNANHEKAEAQENSNTESVGAAPEVHLTPITHNQRGTRFSVLVFTEIKMLLKGQPKYWYIVAVGLAIAGLFAPAQAQAGLWLAAVIWPVLIWSQLGTREALFNTGAYMFSTPEPLLRQLPSSWVAGVAISVALTFSFGFRMFLAHDFGGVLSWLASVIFIPSFALAMGTLSGNKKAFEAIYTAWWYIGPAHQLTYLDFLGVAPASRTAALYVVLSATFLAAAVLARRNRLAYA